MSSIRGEAYLLVYNQWQPRYASLKSTLGDEIQFTQGLPTLSEDLSEISSKFNNVLVFDDLMSQATDSPGLSKLFTQGCHRNASTILLFQNMFRKGNSTQILAGMPNTWYSFVVQVTERKLTLSQSGFLRKTVQTLWRYMRKKPKSLMDVCWWTINPRRQQINKLSRMCLVLATVTHTSLQVQRYYKSRR